MNTPPHHKTTTHQPSPRGGGFRFHPQETPMSPDPDSLSRLEWAVVWALALALFLALPLIDLLTGGAV